MSSINRPNRFTERTHEGAPAARSDAEQQLRRAIMACMLWENQFYESGQDIADRISFLVPQVDASKVMEIALEARTNMKLRHAPLLLACAMAPLPDHKQLVAHTLEQIIQRPDELTEFLAIYWRNGKTSISAQVKKGLAAAFLKFNEYSLAKYNRDGAIKLRDVMFMVHPKPENKAQEALFKKVADDTLATPDTWEVELSAGKDKKEVWTRLINEKKLGALAILRNLRNMEQAGVDPVLIEEAILSINTFRVLPFRFLSAMRYAHPQFHDVLERSMYLSITQMEKLPGKTIFLVDISGSMMHNVSKKSDLKRYDAAAGLTILGKELCESSRVFLFNDFIQELSSSIRGFSLGEEIKRHVGGGTKLGKAVKYINSLPHDRLIVITDEQSMDVVPRPTAEGWMVNIASYQNGIANDFWHRIEGWSENIFNYILECQHG